LETLTNMSVHLDNSNLAKKILFELFIDPGQKLLTEICDAILNEIHHLKQLINSKPTEIAERNRRIELLEGRINHFESNLFLRDTKLDAYELVRLFQFYYVDTLVRDKYPQVKVTQLE
jgi:hypothetical protein